MSQQSYLQPIAFTGTKPFVPLVGYISPSYNDAGTYAFGSLKGEDASPIKNKDILYFFAENPDSPILKIYSIAFKATPEVKNYLASKVQSDGGESGQEIVYNIILNINGKEYPNCGGGVDDFAVLGFCPPGPIPPTSSVPAFKQGETYNFSFK